MAFSTIVQGPMVLVVEDEPLLRMHAVDLLEEAGFSTIEAGDADEAIRILDRRSDIRLVVTDVQMPGSMDGLRLAAAVRNRWPPIDLVITSGFLARIEPSGLPSGSRFLAKPYDDAHLVGIVTYFLHAAPA